jgi:hypothetical protein
MSQVAQEAQPIGIAKVTRSIPIQFLDASGSNEGRLTLPSGTLFAVLEVSVGEVIGSFQGRRFRAPQGALTLMKLPPDKIAAVLNAAIIVVKARYGEANRQARSVKSEIQKLIAQGQPNPMTGKLEILVADQIILGKRAKPKIASGMITPDGAGGVNVSVLQPQAKTLEIEYQWQGQTFNKTLIEGQILTLP